MISIWLLIYFLMCNSPVSQNCLPSSNTDFKVDNKTDSSSSSLNKRIFLLAETFASFLRKYILGNSQNKLKYLRQKRKILDDEESIDNMVSPEKDLIEKNKVVRTENESKINNAMSNNGSNMGNNLLKAITKLIEEKQMDVTVGNDEDNRENMSKIVISYKYKGKKSNVDEDVDEDEEDEDNYEVDKEDEDEEEEEEDVENEKKEKLKKNVLKEMESILGLTTKKIKICNKTFTTIILKQESIILKNKTLPSARTHKVYHTKVKILNGYTGDIHFPTSRNNKKIILSSKHKNNRLNISFTPIMSSAKDHSVNNLRRSRVKKLKVGRFKRQVQNTLFGDGDDDRLLLVKPKLMKPFKFHSEANIDFHIRSTNFTQDEVPVDISIDNTHSKTSGQR